MAEETGCVTPVLVGMTTELEVRQLGSEPAGRLLLFLNLS